MSHPVKRTVMEWLRETFPSVWKTTPPPVILTQWGPVTESARRQAAINMRLSPDLRERVERVVIREMGGDEAKGMAECRRRYPECYS